MLKFLLFCILIVQITSFSLYTVKNFRFLLLAEANSSPKYGGVQHCGILVKDTELSKAWFMEMFGWKDDTHLRNPELPFKGAFLRFGTDQVHLMELPNPDPMIGRPDHGGRDRHIALTVNNIELIKEKLESKRHPYTMSKSGRRALFTRDLDMNAFEFIEDEDLNL